MSDKLLHERETTEIQSKKQAGGVHQTGQMKIKSHKYKNMIIDYNAHNGHMGHYVLNEPQGSCVEGCHVHQILLNNQCLYYKGW